MISSSSEFGPHEPSWAWLSCGPMPPDISAEGVKAADFWVYLDGVNW